MSFRIPMNARRLELDFIAPPRAPRAAGLAILLASVLTAGWLVARYHEVALELDRIEAARGLNVERRPARAQTREALDQEIRSVEATLRQLALPWGVIIETVEEATTPDVAILRMEPDAQQRQLKLGAEARTREAMLDYLRQLGAARSLSDVHLVSHQVQMDDPLRPIQFTVQALLRDTP